MNIFYEVTLILEAHVNDIHNPTFVFGAKDAAMQLVEVFSDQGYKASLSMVEKD